MVKSGFFKHLDSFIAAVIGFIAVYFFTRYNGVGISPDAVMYASTARNLCDHGTLNFFNGTPIVDFPVFYPIFLGIIYFVTSIDPVAAGAVVDGLLFGGVILMTGIIIRHFAPKSFIYKWLILAAVILSQALLQVYSYLWSETLFIFIVLLSFFSFANYFNRKTIGSLVLAAIIAAIAAITRYAGVTVIVTGGVLLLFYIKLPLRKRWKPLIIYSLISCSLLIINLLYNRLATGNSTGAREQSITGFADNLYYFGNVIGNWFIINPLSRSVAIIIASMALLILIVLFISKILEKHANVYIFMAITFSLVYGLFIVLSATFSRYEQINNRLLSPMYIPLLLSLTWWLVHLPQSWERLPKWGLCFVFGLNALFIEFRLYQIDYQRYDDQSDYGNPGYTDDSWKDSGLIKYLRGHTEFFNNAPIYSDAYEAVYFFTGQRHVILLPHRYFETDINQFYRQNKFYLIWFKDLENPELINLKDVQKRKKIKLVQQFNDGAIYEYDAANVK